MSLFGHNSSGTLFGTSAQNAQPKPLNPFAAVGTTQPPAGSGLSVNTTTAPSQSGGGIFGSSAVQSQQSGGLFGAPASGQPQPPGNLFGSTPSSQPQQGGSLFGTSTTTQPQQPGSIFGAPQGGAFGSAGQPQQQGTSLFGGGAQAQTQAQGQSQNLNQLQQQQQQQGSGLFGGATAQNKPPTLSLFGNNATGNQQNPAQSTLFGAPLGGQQANQNVSLFGTSTGQQPAPQSQPSLFGSTAGRMPGQLMMGQSANQPQQPGQTVPGVKIDVSNIRGTTRFNDLHEELQKQIEQIDAFIQQQIAFKEQCDAIMPAHEQNLSTIPGDVEFVRNKLETTELALDNDSSAIDHMKTVVQQDAENARIGFRAVENLKLPQQFHYAGAWNPTSSAAILPPARSATGTDPSSTRPARDAESTDLVTYFNTRSAELAKTLETFTQNISDIEIHLGTVEASTVAQSRQLMFRRGKEGGARSKEEQIRELAAVLREFEAGILGVAAKVGRAREEVGEVVDEGSRGVVLSRRR